MLVAAGVLLAVAVNQPLVAAIAEPRPNTMFPDALVLVARTTDPAFPSDHATMAGAAAVGLLLAARGHRTLRGWAVVTAVAAVVMAAARVYVGAHLPGDVAAGLLLRGLVALAAQLALRPMTLLAEGLERSPLRSLVRASDSGTAGTARAQQPGDRGADN